MDKTKDPIFTAFNLGVIARQEKQFATVKAAPDYFYDVIYGELSRQYKGFIDDALILTYADYLTSIALLGYILPHTCAYDKGLENKLIDLIRIRKPKAVGEFEELRGQKGSAIKEKPVQLRFIRWLSHDLITDRLGKRMDNMNITVEKLAIGEESQQLNSVANKTAAVPGSSARGYAYNNGILDHKELSDKVLARSFVETEDEEAFNEIVNRYGDKIYRLALRITHNPTDAEDVLQEVFITLIEKLDTFHEESKFSTWLYRVTANASFIHLRTERKYTNNVSLENYAPYDEGGVLNGVVAKDWSDRPDEVLLSKEVMEIIEKAVNELPVTYRAIFHLRDAEGLTNPEISKMLGLSLPNVKFRIQRARLFLRDRLSDYLYEWRK